MYYFNKNKNCQNQWKFSEIENANQQIKVVMKYSIADNLVAHVLQCPSKCKYSTSNHGLFKYRDICL